MQPIVEALPWLIAGGAILALLAAGLLAGALLYGAHGGGMSDALRASGIGRRSDLIAARLRSRYLLRQRLRQLGDARLTA